MTAPSFVRLTTHDSRLTLLAGLLLGLGIADKSWPAILLPVLFFMLQGRQTRLLFLAGAAAPVVVSLAAYALLIRVGPLHPLQEAVSYRAFTGVWGLSLLATKLQLVWPGVAPVAHFLELHGDSVDLLAAFAAAFWLRRTPGRERNCLAVILVAFAAASGWGFHWLVWVLPFAALASERRARLYTALGACQYVLIYFVFGGVAWGFTYLTSSLAVLRYTWLLSLPLWLFIVAWAGAEIRGLATSADHEGSIREIPGSLSKSVSRV